MRPTIQQLRALADFCPSYRWDMNAVLPAVIAQAIDSYNLNLRVTSVSIPKRSVDPVEISNRGHKIYREGITSFSQQISFSTVGTVDAMVHKAIRNWGQMQWSDEYGRMSTNTPADRQGTITISALNNTDESYWQYQIFGCWLQDSDFGEFGSDSSDILRPNMTLSYDYFVDGPSTSAS